MFEGIKPKTFLSTPKEWHALLIGFFEVLCPWPARYEKCDSCHTSLKGEEHYYAAGRGIGFVALLLILIGLAKLVETIWR